MQQELYRVNPEKVISALTSMRDRAQKEGNTAEISRELALLLTVTTLQESIAILSKQVESLLPYYISH